jgi:glucose 1-dehydrogenase
MEKICTAESSCSELYKVTGKTALITGASRGIGKGIALVMAANGYDVAITYSTQKEAAEEVFHSIENEYGRKCFVYQANLEDPVAPERIVEDAIKDLGRLDVLVNNAVIHSREDIFSIEADRITKLFNANFRGPILSMKAAAKYMTEHGIKGNMVNITSTRALRTYPDDFLYGGYKAALTRAAESIALQLSPYGIRVNCIAPGFTANRGEESKEFYLAIGKKIPLGRVGTPEEMGNAVLWMVSDHASYITGTTLKIDGGLILPGMPEDINPEAGYGWGRPHRKK